jgi:hypothetical protein
MPLNSDVGLGSWPRENSAARLSRRNPFPLGTAHHADGSGRCSRILGFNLSSSSLRFIHRHGAYYVGGSRKKDSSRFCSAHVSTQPGSRADDLSPAAIITLLQLDPQLRTNGDDPWNLTVCARSGRSRAGRGGLGRVTQLSRSRSLRTQLS